MSVRKETNHSKLSFKSKIDWKLYLSTDFRRVRCGGVGPMGGGVFVDVDVAAGVDDVGVDPLDADDTGRRTLIDE